MGIAIGVTLYLVWTLVTYLLEGRVRTLQRPDAAGARLAYAVVANMLIGTVGSMIAILWILRTSGVAAPDVHGFSSPTRTLVSIVLGLVLGLLVFAIQRPPSWNPVILLNGFSQTVVVSVAEVLVCWAVLGAAVVTTGSQAVRGVSIVAGLVISALAFGAYHFAHSPPFNTVRMVLLLSGVGLATGAFFFLSRDVYGTIVFHNFLALKGVTQALADSGQLGSFRRVQLPLVLTALLTLLLLVILDLALVRPTILGLI